MNPDSLAVDLGTFTELDALLIAAACRFLAMSLPDDRNGRNLRTVASFVELRTQLARRRAEQQNDVVVLP